MATRLIEAPEQRWGSKVYQLTGEITSEAFMGRFDPANASGLKKLLSYLRTASLVESCDLHILAVGSSANLSWPDYNDIDLLVCPREEDKRSTYAERAKDILQLAPELIVNVRTPDLSAPTEIDINLYGLYEPFKIKARPRRDKLEIGKLTQYDVAFVRDSGGSYDEIMAFHRLNRLAFCEILDEQQSISL